MFKEICLHGHLANEFGTKPVRVDVASVAEAVRAACTLRHGLKEELRKGWYKVVCKRPDGDLQIGEESLHLFLGKTTAIHIIPVMAGAKPQGIGKIVIGVALVAGAFLFAPAALGLGATAFGVAGASITYGNIAMIGLSLALAGASAMLAPQVGKTDPNAGEEKKTSFLFNGPVNVAGQGHPVPLVYGRMRVGSVVASAGITTENSPVDPESGSGSTLT